MEMKLSSSSSGEVLGGSGCKKRPPSRLQKKAPASLNLEQQQEGGPGRGDERDPARRGQQRGAPWPVRREAEDARARAQRWVATPGYADADAGVVPRTRTQRGRGVAAPGAADPGRGASVPDAALQVAVRGGGAQRAAVRKIQNQATGQRLRGRRAQGFARGGRRPRGLS